MASGLNVQQLLTDFSRELQLLSQMHLLHRNCRVVVVFGPSGSGKSTMINAIARRQLMAVLRNWKYLFVCADPVPGMEVGSSVHSMTLTPHCWFDGVDTVYIDLPGVRGETRGPMLELRHAFVVRSLFRLFTDIRVAIVAKEADLDGRAHELRQTAAQLAASFEGDDLVKLCDCACFVVTHSSRFPQASDVREYMENSIISPLQETNHLEPHAAGILQAMARRVALFASPQREGPLSVEDAAGIRAGVLSVLSQAAPAASLTPSRVALSAEAIVFSTEALAALLSEIQELIDSQVCPAILHHLQDCIRNAAHAVELREGLANFYRSFPTSCPQRIDSFVESVSHTFQAAGIPVGQLLEKLALVSFLLDCDINLHISYESWFVSLQRAVAAAQRLSQAPTWDNNRGQLAVSGPVVFISDVLAAMEHSQAAGAAQIKQVHCSCWHLILDCDVIARGTWAQPAVSFALFCIHGRVVNATERRIFDLSGLDGGRGLDGTQPGQHGQPGEPGAHGANFHLFARTFEGADLLQINTSGGSGGVGGSGDRGHRGQDGTDGDLTKYTMEEFNNWWGTGERNRTMTKTYWYRDPGTNGTPGGDGGRGGAAGPAGLAGTASAEGLQLLHVVSAPGTSGTEGRPGSGGLGGIHGRHCCGKIVDRISFDRHNNVMAGSHSRIEEVACGHVEREPTHAPSGETPDAPNSSGQPVAAAPATLSVHSGRTEFEQVAARLFQDLEI